MNKQAKKLTRIDVNNIANYTMH